MKRDKIIVAIHGILTREIPSAWQEQFAISVWENDSGIEVLRRKYFEWPLPVVNMLKNHFHAHALAEELLPYAKAGADISFVTHSNGADIGLRTVKLLAKWGQKVHTLVCIAGVLHPDVSKNGIAELVDSGALGKAVAYFSHQDKVLGGIPAILLWPYDRLGCMGFNSHGKDYFFTGRIANRIFPGYDHGTYFDAAHSADTFGKAVADCL